MQTKKAPPTAQLRGTIDAGRTGSKAAASDPAAAPLGTDDEAADNTPSSDRVAMAREAEDKIGKSERRQESGSSRNTELADQAHSQRGSSAPYAREEHMNDELAKQKAAERQAS